MPMNPSANDPALSIQTITKKLTIMGTTKCRRDRISQRSRPVCSHGLPDGVGRTLAAERNHNRQSLHGASHAELWQTRDLDSDGRL